MARLTKISFILLLFFTSRIGYAIQLFDVEVMELKNKIYQLEIADTFLQKRQGLMHRKTLQKNAGMLFVYFGPADHRIWMKNTLIPLTVIWLDENARIINIKILQPCKSMNCPVSSASKPSKFILELHQNQYTQFNIGDQLPAILDWNEGNKPTTMD